MGLGWGLSVGRRRLCEIEEGVCWEHGTVEGGLVVILVGGEREAVAYEEVLEMKL